MCVRVDNHAQVLMVAFRKQLNIEPNIDDRQPREDGPATASKDRCLPDLRR